MTGYRFSTGVSMYVMCTYYIVPVLIWEMISMITIDGIDPILRPEQP